MKIQRSFWAVAFCSIYLFPMACGDKKSSSKPDGEKPAVNQGPLNKGMCPDLWQQKLADNKVGTVLEYETIVEMSLPNGAAESGSTMPGTTTTTRSEVISATDEKIITKVRATTNGNTSERDDTLLKSDFIKGCELAAEGAASGSYQFPDDLEVNVSNNNVETRKESITVRAGTFETTYVKSLTDTAASRGETSVENESVVEAWYINDGFRAITIKSKISMERNMGGYKMTVLTTRELIDYKRP